MCKDSRRLPLTQHCSAVYPSPNPMQGDSRVKTSAGTPLLLFVVCRAYDSLHSCLGSVLERRSRQRGWDESVTSGIPRSIIKSSQISIKLSHGHKSDRCSERPAYTNTSSLFKSDFESISPEIYISVHRWERPFFLTKKKYLLNKDYLHLVK